MKNSDTFSQGTKRDLADRAGHHCSLCLALTTCSDEKGKPFPIGDAAHQAAASPGGPRYNSKQTKRERSSAANGLWLCSSCHRKIDGDKYRYSIEDLKQMKEEAEERARRMVHGQIVFEMKNQEQAAIEYYLASRPLTNELPRSGFGDQSIDVPTGGMLGIQIVPHTAISERPHLSYPDIVAHGVPNSQNVIHGEGSDSKGVFVARRMEVARFDRDATAQAWIGYPRLNPPEPGWENLLSGFRIAQDILTYIANARVVLGRHNIQSPRLIVRARFENVRGKILRHSDHDSIQLSQPAIETSPVTIDIGEEKNFLDELWYSIGSVTGLPASIGDRL